jgi:hypothetical protein
MPEKSKLHKVTASVKKFIEQRQQRICRDHLTRLNYGSSEKHKMPSGKRYPEKRNDFGGDGSSAPKND